MPRFVPMTATILAGESLSSPIDCSTGTPVMIYMPHEWTSAHLSFQVSPDGTNYNDLFDSDGHELHSSVTAGTSVRLDPMWEPVTYLKLRSGTRDSPVPQQADRVITITLDTRAATRRRLEWTA